MLFVLLYIGPSLQACVYITRSLHCSENELAVNNALKQHRSNNNNKRSFKVCPPTLPLTSYDINDDDNVLHNNYLKLKQSNEMNGCFIAVITREVNIIIISLSLFPSHLSFVVEFSLEYSNIVRLPSRSTIASKRSTVLK